MINFYIKEYQKKFTFADEAVKHVKVGNYVRYAFGLCQTNELDLALARRKEELKDVYLLCESGLSSYAAFESDLDKEHFNLEICEWGGLVHPFDKSTKNNCIYPGLIVMATVSPMDKNGYFWLPKPIPQQILQTELEEADYVIVEVNENIPNHKKAGCQIHISQVNAIVPSNNSALLTSVQFEHEVYLSFRKEYSRMGKVV